MPKFDWSNLGPFVTAVKTACGRGSMDMGLVVQGDVQTHFGGGRFMSGPVGMPPNKQRGRLANSIQVQARGNSAIVGSNLPYGHIHEFGGVIRAKKTKYLPIPLNMSARALAEKGGTGGLKTKGTFKLISPNFGRTLLLVRDTKFKAKMYINGADGKRKYKTLQNTEPVFMLKRSVRMPKRPFMAPALKRAQNNPAMVRVFAVGTTKGLAKAGFRVQVVPA